MCSFVAAEQDSAKKTNIHFKHAVLATQEAHSGAPVRTVCSSLAIIARVRSLAMLYHLLSFILNNM
jgi:hypothetical protein